MSLLGTGPLDILHEPVSAEHLWRDTQQSSASPAPAGPADSGSPASLDTSIGID